MAENDREFSARSSRRRRWEVKAKESFEIPLAIDAQKQISLVDKSDLNTTIKEHFETNSAAHEGNLTSITYKREDGFEKTEGILRNTEEKQCESPCPPYEESSPTAPPLSASSDAVQSKKYLASLPQQPPQYGSNMITSKLSEQLFKLHDDVIEGKIGSKRSASGLGIPGVLLGPSSSTHNGAINTIYCERLNNFVAANEDQVMPGMNASNFDPVRKISPASHAIFLQSGFRTFSIWCQGIFAGFALAHCILVFMLDGNIDIFYNITSLENIFHALIFFLSAVCLVSAFDRCDLAGQGIFSGHGLRIPWTPFFYLVTFVLSVIMIRAEDFITHYNMYPADVQKKQFDMIMWWKYMILSRSLLALISWMALVTDPYTDALNSRIAELVISP